MEPVACVMVWVLRILPYSMRAFPRLKSISFKVRAMSEKKYGKQEQQPLIDKIVVSVLYQLRLPAG